MGQCNGCEKTTLGTDAQWEENVKTQVIVHPHARERCMSRSLPHGLTTWTLPSPVR